MVEYRIMLSDNSDGLPCSEQEVIVIFENMGWGGARVKQVASMRSEVPRPAGIPPVFSQVHIDNLFHEPKIIIYTSIICHDSQVGKVGNTWPARV